MTAGYHTLRELQEQAVLQNREVWEIVRNADMSENERSAEASFEKMTIMYQAMKQADQSYNGALRSASGRAGGDGAKLQQYNAQGKNICGDFIGKVMEKAIKMGESNACMRRIVAAPTAGSCGVLPAVLLSYEEDFSATQEDLVKALYVAAGIGTVIAENASLAGASGGCQAEIGSACAMGAALYAWILGLNNSLIEYAAEMGLEHSLGLTCDPVGGYVQIPCIERNGYAALRAIDCAIYAKNLGYVRKNKVSFDAVVNVMKNTGHDLNKAYKETSLGGLALEFDL